MHNTEWKRHLYGELIVLQQEAFAHAENELAQRLTDLAADVEWSLKKEEENDASEPRQN